MKKQLLAFIFTTGVFSFLNAQTTHNVSMAPGDVFSPVTLSINKGDIVVWTNNDNEVHTARSGAGCTSTGVWDSGNLANGQTFSFTFNTAGTFDYNCEIHCSMGMVGTITVTDIGVSGVASKVSNELELKAFPNPFVNSANIEFTLSEGGKVKMEVFDVMGKKVLETNESLMSSGQQSIEINAAELSEGVFICKILFDDQTVASHRLVKSMK